MIQAEAEQQNKPIDWLNIGLWAVKFAVLFTSARHVAEAFLSLERAGTHAFWGWLPALATDGGLLFMAWKLKSDSKSKVLWGGFIWFLVMSAFAQIDHAIQNVNFTGDNLYDGWQVVKIGLFAFSLPFLVAFMVVVASKRQSATTETGTGLATTNRNHEPQPPKVKVRRRDNRLQRPATAAALPDNLPVMQKMHPATTGNSEPQPANYGQVTPKSTNAPRTREPEPEPVQVEVIETNETLDAAIQAVHLMQLGHSLADIATMQGISSNGVRKRLRIAYRQDPEAVAVRIPDWVENNQKFLSE